jgi:adenylate cyclase
MFTDMVGYTAKVQADEADALRSLREQEELVRPLLATHQGREVKSTGDGFLVEFDSALRAVQCAIDILQRMHERNSQIGISPVELRIGIHLGDVELHGSDIFGDSVNIAARIEPLAEPGGVCISEPVFEQVRNKIPNSLEKLEPRALKNVRFPLDIYRVVLPWSHGQLLSANAGPSRLAVLPFANISPDPKDEYFADGLTEEMITVLAQLRELRVIARTSVSQYRSTTKSVSQIGAELGVGTVLEGSVRKAGDQLRITVQLIDVGTQEHLWAGTYDRKLENVFALQTEIAKQVAEQLKVGVRSTDEVRLGSRQSVRPESYLAYLKGLTCMRTSSSESLRAAKAEFERAIALDDRNAAAHAGLAEAAFSLGIWYTDSSQRDWEEASRRSAARALELNPNQPDAHVTLAEFSWRKHDYPGAEKEFQLALALNPSHSPGHTSYAVLLEDQGRTDEALVEFSLAEAADPLWAFPVFQEALLLLWLRRLDDCFAKLTKLEGLGRPMDTGYRAVLAEYYYVRGDLEKAVKAFHADEWESANPHLRTVVRAWNLAVSGDKEQARTVLRADPSLPEFGQSSFFMAWVYAILGDLDDVFRMLNKAIDVETLPFQRIRLDPQFEATRKDPRYQLVLRRLNLS